MPVEEMKFHRTSRTVIMRRRFDSRNCNTTMASICASPRSGCQGVSRLCMVSVLLTGNFFLSLLKMQPEHLNFLLNDSIDHFSAAFFTS